MDTVDNGAFGLKVTGVDALTDENGNRGLGTGWESTVAEKLLTLGAHQRRVDTRGPQLKQISYRGVATAAATDLDTTLTVPSAPVREGFIIFDLLFDELVIASSTTLRVTVGQSTVSTRTLCVPPTASERLRCSLEVDPGWLDTDGLSTPANPLNYMSIKDDLDNPATTAFATQRFPKIEVDAAAPTVRSTSISIPRAEAGSDVIVKVTFSEEVKVSETVPPVAAITIDGGNRHDATFLLVSGKVVEFRYSLRAIDLAPRTAGNTSSLAKLAALTTTGITDIAGNGADNVVTDTAAFRTGTTFARRTTGEYDDKIAPTLERISLAGDVKEVYGIGDTITFKIFFSEPVAMPTSGANWRTRLGMKNSLSHSLFLLAGEGVTPWSTRSRRRIRPGR